MSKYCIIMLILSAMLVAGCAVPAQKRSNDPYQRRPASGLFGGVGQKSSQPPDQPPQDDQRPRK